MRIITNNAERQFLTSFEVPVSVLADYDHLNVCDHTDGWIKYRNTYYHLSDFIGTSNGRNDCMWFAGWHGYTSDSAFSGVVIQLSDDCETYRIATYIC